MSIGDDVWSQHEDSTEPIIKKVKDIFITPDKEILKIEFQNTDGDKEIIRVTLEHPFKVENRGWVNSENLEKGDQIITFDGEFVQVVNVTKLTERQTVYNIEIENTHTFFVGKNGLFVHNICGGKIDPRNKILKENI